MDEEQVTHIDLRSMRSIANLSLFSQRRACHIVLVVTRLILLAHNSDVVVSAMGHSGTHQVYRAGIDADVLLIGMLLMDRSCHKRTVRASMKRPSSVKIATSPIPAGTRTSS